MPPTDRIAHLTTAFEWQCDECGTRNFCSAIEVEEGTFDLPDREEEGSWCMVPSTVVCSACKTRFRSTDGSFDPKESP